MDSKIWYESKFFWLGVLQITSAVCLMAAELVNKGSVTPADIFIFASGVVTLVIRIFFSDQKLSL